MREKRLTIAVVILVCVGLLMYLVVFSVRVDQVAAQYRAGRVVRIIRPTLAAEGIEEGALARSYTDATIVTHAGWFWKLPWPFDRVERFDQRVRNVDGPASQTQLPDGNHIIPRVYATWRIYDPVAFQKSLRGDIGNAEQRLRGIIGNETQSVFGQHTLDDVVNTDGAKLKFDLIEKNIYEGVRKDLAPGVNVNGAYGIEVLSLGIQRIALPDDTTAAVFTRMAAERNAVADNLLAEGDKIRRTEIAEASQQRDIILAEAEGVAKDTRSRGEAEAAQYYGVFAKNEALAVFLRRLESLRMIAANAEADQQPITLVIDTKTPPFDAFVTGPKAGTLLPPAVPVVQGGAKASAPSAPVARDLVVPAPKPTPATPEVN